MRAIMTVLSKCVFAVALTGVMLLSVACAGLASTDQVINYTPRPCSQQRAEQRIVHVEGMGGVRALTGDDNNADLALTHGGRIRVTQGYSRLWAVEAIVLAGQARVTCGLELHLDDACEPAAHALTFARAAFGGVFRFGDKRIPHVRGNLGVEWTRHPAHGSAGGTAGEMAEMSGAEHELSLIPTLGVGYDRRFGQNVIIGVTASLSWIAMSNLRERGFHSVDTGVRFGIGW